MADKDKDERGYNHARDIAEILRPIAASVVIVEAALGKDVADHIAAGYALDELVDAEIEPETDKPDPSRFFDPHTGLRVLTLATAVTDCITCGYGSVDDRFYVYERGVWVPNREP